MAVPGSRRARKPSKQGRKQARKTQRGRSHREVSPSSYKPSRRNGGGSYEIFRDEWRIVVQPGQFVHKRGKKWVPDKKPRRFDFDNEVTSIDWTETESGRTGNVTISYGEDEDTRHRTITIQEGWLFILYWRKVPGAAWRELWRMRAMSPSINASAREVTFELMDDLGYLRLSSDSFKYGKSKKHPNGMRVEQIIRAICALYRQPVGKLARMKTRVEDFKVDGSPYDAILKAIERETQENEGRKLVIRSNKGRLEVVPLKPSVHAYALGPAIIDATYRRSLKNGFASALRIRGTLGKAGKQKKKKALVTVKSPSAIKKYGYIVQDADPPDRAHSRQKFRHFGRNELRRRARPQKEFDFTHPGIPFLRRWDAIKVVLRTYGPPKKDLGKNQIVWVTEVTHTVLPGDYNMQVAVQFTDPFADTSEEKKLEKKCKKAKLRGRKQAHACKEVQKSRKKDKNANQHKDKHDKRPQKRKK